MSICGHHALIKALKMEWQLTRKDPGKLALSTTRNVAELVQFK